MSIIRRFSFVVLSLTRHLYKEYESVQTTSGISGILSRSVTILKISDANTLRVTRLHLVEL
ncbi:hypothetical protein PTT_11551 [Pyrenophora teres f. teres 0-1]|uniref:Uncharacterized protein n=1 Tax=Pyrenophora teres f. teres (strain 0-1) TaxID=861557 RepID=E3RRT4_PYRTT|nr:hypothetical protein PTT_11551 [Pyrenophora teres f. teres 0-1]